IARRNEYAKAAIPMLPVTHGTEFTRLHILLYTVLLLLVTLLPYLTGMTGLLYLLVALPLSFKFIYQAVIMMRKKDDATAMKTFWFSIIYLSLVFAALLLDHYFRFTLYDL
ncbi:MAG: protoheme IX farnesyltransferase, partial [Methylobacter sp.]